MAQFVARGGDLDANWAWRENIRAGLPPPSAPGRAAHTGGSMGEVTQILDAIGRGEPRAAGQLLPLVYEELRRLAAARMAREVPGQTLDATALVHEAYLRLVGNNPDRPWDGQGHFFAAAAEAMRRILIENSRRKRRLRRGGDAARDDLDPAQIAAPEPPDELLAIDEALEKLAQADPQAAELVKLRYFAGLPIPRVAELMGLSPRSADRLWAYARAWLRREIRAD